MKKTILSALVALLLGGTAVAQDIKLAEHNDSNGMPLMNALAERHTVRSYSTQPIALDELSNLLWATYGYNRPEVKKRTAPSAVNMQEMDIYVYTTEAIYLYNAANNMLEFVTKGDYRKEISTQPHFGVAPISIVIVADYDRMKEKMKLADPATLDFYAAVDCGYVSQNIYLYATAAQLGTVACGGIDREAISKRLGLKNAKPMLAHPVGFPQE
ncbi:MAG: SagB/ThcOx family dehydrogenase [Bacteroidales bacterium]|nr:SagB/ThcOx family dehydrogenase [Bacteroidales bacterium]